MIILIVGNGFDLSHYLPTKYDLFMVAMGAIENWDEQKGEMQFDDLFGSLYEKENYFFKYTKAMYQTDEIKISTEQVKELKQKLKENVWYQYFSDHVREIKTWIDFEQKIEEALIYTTHFLDKINEVSLNENKLERVIRTSGYKASDYDNKFIYLGEKMCHVLCSIGLLNKDYYNVGYDDNGRFRKEIATEETNSHEYVISSKFIRSFSNYDIYNNEGGLNFLNNQLDSFILIFNLYLELFIKTLTPIVDLIEDFNFGFVDKIFSFNYTNTYIKFYDASVDTDFLHGSCGENQNIVLGISELKGDLLRNLKAYGFTKYHQKLFKNTDYQFLSEDRNIQKILNFWKVIKERNLAITLAEKEKHIINIFIWGHSLDISDEIYINEVFSLNDGKYFNTNVIIYYFDNHAKFNLLTNLLHILGKEKVELWMKKGWLKFEPNPNIVELNNIEPVDLTKLK
ncbi:AbiH family protein [Acinetobacter baumannii]|uniref:AbiH family protein n=3 Tax=Acinetobacter baumannii TaxID=470 RepID=UPI0026DFC923|nr:AbiH family protein [Acinetobacter baumannii]MDO5924081.1 AbiH family protein [Acinetobacter baumannii]